MLEVSPETENRVRQFALRAGLNTDELVTRLLDKADVGLLSLPTLQDRLRASDDEKRAKVLAYINASPEEIKRINAPSIALLQAQIDSAKDATPEEIAEADREWEEHKREMHENRYGNDECFPHEG